ncbi:MAG: amidohydrolase family protein [Pseudomonadaceae bacterium]|nr:amidohydrolase family protein [Pseudomonadaceae bacterium]
MLIKNAEIAGRLVDVRTADTVVEVGADLVPADEPVIEARGCALLPGLHDHHIHLFATATAAASVDCSALQPGDETGLANLISQAPLSGWRRVVGYHESVAGDLDRYRLDQLSGPVPVRLQHASGKLWVLNSLALQALQIDESSHAGIERDGAGVPTGRIWRSDGWLRARLNGEAPDLRPLSNRLAAFGITGVTDTSYTNNQNTIEVFTAAQRSGHLLQHLYVMGDDSLSAGPLKIMLDEDDLPPVDLLVERIVAARHRGRSVAFHCVSHVELVFALAALQQAGYSPSDRIEHGGVVRPDVLSQLQDSGATVVTQPGFVWARGARYQRDADAADRPHIYPFASLLAAGISAVSSSDAPYGPLNPWLCMATAVTRCCADGSVLNPSEAVTPAVALSGYLSSAQAPGGKVREIAPGLPADLVLLDRSIKQAYADLTSVKVQATWIDGQLVYDSSASTS